ncbi:P-loop containing nucleoside triphosphate hydrolase protein [Ilyonectria robusta]|uniref:P-loop containing nucleoside triphosphate hydrolase protein n=1 Tax=Ilyonectria robusta TaxID=1079257 RepID=UPI001E8E3EF4|nr:P-loop containing nucleoside triphosphate hydrolase protein [Ilyonectria robusta]KAH8656468.1 P-loop containing nucleoside triphosphate hydrolase protein [Ilyonectria robusta]
MGNMDPLAILFAFSIPAQSNNTDPTAPAAARRQNPPDPRKPFSTVPFPPDPDFVDRPDILKWMHGKCARPASRIALVGLGGIGKSQLAIQYAHQVQQRTLNTWVFWVHASTRGRFEEAYRSIADRLELPRRNDPDVNVFRLVSEWLRVEENGPWEMILDNADDVGVFFSTTQERLASFLPQNCNGSIVVTSRNMDVAERLVGGWSNILTIPAMKTEEACQLLQEKLEVGYDAGAATDLVRTLDHMPLAITQAAAFINRRAPRMSIPTYLNEFRGSNKNKASILNKDAGDLRRDESASNSIVTAWQITFEQIRRERPSAANLLSFMSFFNPQGIPESALQAYARNHKEDVLEDDLETLRGYLLVAVMADKEIFEMHALVQFCTQVWLSSFSNIQQWKREFLKVISDQYPSGEYKNWPECERLDPHIDKILKEEPNSTEDVLRWATLLTNAGWYRWMKGIYEEAREMNQHALETRERYEEAEQMNRRALDAREKVLGREHPSTLTSVYNLAYLFHRQTHFSEAAKLYQRACNGYVEVLGSDHPTTRACVAHYRSLREDMANNMQKR